jgi:hypothetical protein
MILSNSRYADSQVIIETVNGKDVAYITPSQPRSYTFQYTYYVTSGADRIDTVAAAFLSDPTQWFNIGNANPQVMNFLDLEPATVLRIPSVSASII